MLVALMVVLTTGLTLLPSRSWVPMTRFGEGESEEECECSWVMDYTGHKLEDIVDLNAAEKAMMNLWNQHVNKYQVSLYSCAPQ